MKPGYYWIKPNIKYDSWIAAEYKESCFDGSPGFQHIDYISSLAPNTIDVIGPFITPPED